MPRKIGTRAGMNIVVPMAEYLPMAFIYQRQFWDKKVRIAILALATFIALC